MHDLLCGRAMTINFCILEVIGEITLKEFESNISNFKIFIKFFY